MKTSLIFLALFFLTSTLHAQFSLEGSVTAEDGEPLIGAKVLLSGTTTGVTTNIEGYYKIENIAEGEYEVEFHYGQYEGPWVKKVYINKNTILNYSLKREYQLEAITIDAVRASDNTPATFTNIGKEVIKQRNLGQDVPFLLKGTPSAVVTSDAGAGIGYTGIRIRGSDQSRINGTINGIPLNDAESQQVYWVDLPDFAASADAIQIQRGVGTSTNGAGAFGATINLQTNKLKENAYADFAGSLGSFNTRKASLTLGTGLLHDKFSFDARFSNIASDGYIDRASANLRSYYLSGLYLGKNNSLRFNVFSGHELTYQAWHGIDAETLATDRTYNPAGLRADGSFHDNQVDDYQQTHCQAIYNQHFWGLDGNISLHYTKGSGFYEEYKIGEDLADYGITDAGAQTSDLIRRRWLDNDFYGLTYYLKGEIASGLDATLGGAWNNYEGGHFGELVWARDFGSGEQGQRYYENDANKRDFNVFTKMNYAFGEGWNAYLDLQYRSVGYDFVGYDNDGTNIGQRVQLHFFNPKIGLLRQIGTGGKAYAYFGIANREPNRSDYTESSPSTRPRPETLRNLEVGYKHHWRQAAASANLYFMHYKDQLALTGQINDVGEYTRTNLGKSHRLGLELEGSWQSGSGLALGGNLALSQNKIKTWTEYLDDWDTGGQQSLQYQNTDLAFSPWAIAALDLGYDVLHKKGKGQSLVVSLSNKYVSKQFIDNTSNNKAALDAFAYSDANIIYTFSTKFAKEISLNLLVANVFNNLYVNNAWSYHYTYGGQADYLFGYYPQAGRNFLLGLRVGL
jgi:iron complex outermembrane receptor protein